MLAQLLAFLGVSVVVICTPGPDTALTVRNAFAGGRGCGVATAAGVAAGQAVWTLATGLGIGELISASEPAFLALRLAGAAYLVALGLQSLWTAADRQHASRLRPKGLWPTEGSQLGDGLRPKGLWTTEGSQLGDGLRSPTGGPGNRPGGSGTTRDFGSRPGGSGVTGGPGNRPGGSGVAGSWLTPGRGLRQGVISNLANPKMAAFFLSLLPQFASPERGAAGVMMLGLVFCLMTFAWLALYSAAVDRARVVLGRPGLRRALEGLSGLVLVGFGARLALQQR